MTAWLEIRTGVVVVMVGFSPLGDGPRGPFDSRLRGR
jgi:hypothetical protein